MGNDIKNRIDKLSLDERKLLLHRLTNVVSNGSKNKKSENPKKLVAYIKPADSFDMDVFKADIKRELPEYMVPSSFLLIDDIPLLPNGKVDKNTLRKLQVGQVTKEEVDVEAPKTDIEEKLLKIWEEVLDFEPINTDDNFFEIGGDSILSIQIVAKARNAGIILRPNQIFENQTVAELALFAKTEGIEQKLVEETVEGEVLLSPIQHWFFDSHKAAPSFWNQAVKISNIAALDVSDVKSVVQELVYYHDALRLSFSKESGSWKAKVLDKSTMDSFNLFELGEMVETVEQNKRIEDLLQSVQSECELSEGQLFKCLYFECGETQENQVFLLAHHLVVDMVSWNIIHNDFLEALKQKEKGLGINLKGKTASIKAWGEHMTELSESENMVSELPFWKSQAKDRKAFPTDFSTEQHIVEEASITIQQSNLSKEDTSILLHEANELYNTKIDDLLLTALLIVLSRWAKMDQICFGMEKHGRSADILSVDTSNTVGWFTSYFPVELEYLGEGDLGTQIKLIKEQLRAIPNSGIGYGILKYMSSNPEFSRELDQQPQLVFNYLGNQTKNSNEGDIAFDSLMRGTRDLRSERTYKFEINSYITGGQIHINWSYSEDNYKASTIKQLVEDYHAILKELILYCTNKEKGEYTPSDFPEAGISQDDLDNLFKDL